MIGIALDPGHGGGDKGNTQLRRRRVIGSEAPDDLTADWFIEADFNLSIAYMAYERLATYAGVEPLLLRSRREQHLKLWQRAPIADAGDAALVLSVHVNAWVKPESRGAMVFHWPENERAAKVARAVAASMPESYRTDKVVSNILDRGQDGKLLWPGPKAVVGAYRQDAVLVECFFASNPEDLEASYDTAVRSGLATALLVGTDAYRIATRARKEV
jgi:N-acetylmuramoyl-L-alanine amidase